MSQYEHVHSRETVGDILRRRHPELAGWTDPQCLRLIEEAKENAPPYLGESYEDRVAWIRFYIETKVLGK